MLRRAVHAGFPVDEVAAAAFAAASERKHPGQLVRVLFAECTKAEGTHLAERISAAFQSLAEAEGTLLEDLPDRLDRFHYDLVATPTFHADEAQAYVAGRVPVVAMLVGPGYTDLVHELASLPPGARVGLVCGSAVSADNISDTLRMAGTSGIEITVATIDGGGDFDLIDREADVILVSREGLALGLEERFGRQERVREWTYDFDDSAFELLRRAIDHAHATRPSREGHAKR